MQAPIIKAGQLPCPHLLRHQQISLLRPRNGYARTRERLLSCHAASSRDGAGSDLDSKAKAFGRAAGKRFKATLETVEDGVRRVVAGVDSRFDVSGKASKAAQGVREQAETVNDRLGVRRKLRTAAEDVRRKAPMWRRQYAEFSRTRMGQVTFFVALFVLAYTGILWRLLNLLFILWWLAPLLILPLSNYLNKKAVKEMQAQQVQQRARQAAQNPFFSAFSQAAKQLRQQRGGFTGQPGGSGGAADAGGPIIDVEATTVDED